MQYITTYLKSLCVPLIKTCGNCRKDVEVSFTTYCNNDPFFCSSKCGLNYLIYGTIKESGDEISLDK